MRNTRAPLNCVPARKGNTLHWQGLAGSSRTFCAQTLPSFYIIWSPLTVLLHKERLENKIVRPEPRMRPSLTVPSQFLSNSSEHNYCVGCVKGWLEDRTTYVICAAILQYLVQLCRVIGGQLLSLQLKWRLHVPNAIIYVGLTSWRQNIPSVLLIMLMLLTRVAGYWGGHGFQVVVAYDACFELLAFCPNHYYCLMCSDTLVPSVDLPTTVTL